MSPSEPLDTTQLLVDARAGNGDAFDRLFSHLYRELRSLAQHRLRRLNAGETLSTTALVHEAYLRLMDQSRCDWQDRAHFFALAARAMRFVLIDYARARGAQKRGGGERPIPLDAIQLAADARATELVSLHEALEELALRDARLSRVVEYKFFGGLTFDEIAAVLGLSVPTVKRDWTRARAWLHRSLQSAAS
jgi:RNA polymerase sigma factor (TIGR02999 family)